MRPSPVSVAALVGLVATVGAVFFSSPPAHARPTSAVRPQGEIVTEARPVTADFRGISLNSADNVIVRQGSPAAISISGPAEELARTETVVEKGYLVVRKSGDGKANGSKNSPHVVVTVTLPVVENLRVNSSGDLQTEGTLTGDDLNISLAGSGDVHVSAELTGTCSTGVAGSGDVKLSGRCATHTVRLAGSGDIKAANMRATDVTVKLSGSGDIHVAAAEALTVTISGSGDVRYVGTPARLITNVKGSGSVAKL